MPTDTFTGIVDELPLESLPWNRRLSLRAPGVSGQIPPIPGQINNPLNDSTNSNVMKFSCPIPANCRVSDVILEVETPLANSADAAFASCAVTVGDNSSATQFIGSTETNSNGSIVRLAQAAASTNKVYTAADAIVVNITPTSGKNFASLTGGVIHIAWKLTVIGEIG